MRKIAAYLKILLTIAVLCLIYNRIEWERMVALLTTIHTPYVLLALVLIIAGTLVAALAELQVMKAIHLDLTYWEIVTTNYSSFFYSFVHEFVGAVVRYRRFAGDKNRRGEAVFVMGYEKIQMLLVLYMLSLIGYLMQTELYLEVSEKNMFHVFYLVLGSLFLIMIMVLFIRPIGVVVENVLLYCSKKSVLAKITGKCLDILRIAKQLQARPVRYLAAFLLYCAGVGLGVLVYFLVFKSLHVTLAPVALMWTVSFATIAQSLPFTVYGLGLREGALIYCLSKFYYNSEIGITVGLLMLFINIVPGIMYGVFSIIYSSLAHVSIES